MTQRHKDAPAGRTQARAPETAVIPVRLPLPVMEEIDALQAKWRSRFRNPVVVRLLEAGIAAERNKAA